MSKSSFNIGEIGLKRLFYLLVWTLFSLNVCQMSNSQVYLDINVIHMCSNVQIHKFLLKILLYTVKF